MIATLSGLVTHKGDDHVIIEVQGVGYRVYLSGLSLAALPAGAVTKVWTHEHHRDDGSELYGFLSSAELRVFTRLIAISGVGPRTGMHVMALGSVAEIEEHIDLADAVWIARASGIGKKTAQKIILELKGKLVDAKADDDVVSALVNLGYSREKAVEASSRTAESDGKVEDRLRKALKELRR